jgi:hypothetical protein
LPNAQQSEILSAKGKRGRGHTLRPSAAVAAPASSRKLSAVINPSRRGGRRPSNAKGDGDVRT